MTRYEVRFHTQIEITVTIDAEDDVVAGDAAWPTAQEYLDTVHGNGQNVRAEGTLDGIGATEVVEA